MYTFYIGNVTYATKKLNFFYGFIFTVIIVLNVLIFKLSNKEVLLL